MREWEASGVGGGGVGSEWWWGCWRGGWNGRRRRAVACRRVNWA